MYLYFENLFFLLVGLYPVVPTVYAMSCDDEDRESAHLFGRLPKGHIVFGFSLYTALASLPVPILST